MRDLLELMGVWLSSPEVIPVNTPAERTFSVQPDNREFNVQPDNREFDVQLDNRVFKVP